MKVFLSWSGDRSLAFAKAFHAWLPSVIQDIDPWISSDSVGKGEPWLSGIRDALTASGGVGLFFLTKEALSSEWLFYEAGGIAVLGEKRVCTVCIDMQPGELKPPLSFYQATKLERGDIFKLLETLNQSISKPLAAAILAKTFERAWPDLEVDLAEAQKVGPAKPKAKGEAEAAPTSNAALFDALRRIEGRLGSQEMAIRDLRASTWSPTFPTSAPPFSAADAARRGIVVGSSTGQPYFVVEGNAPGTLTTHATTFIAGKAEGQT